MQKKSSLSVLERVPISSLGDRDHTVPRTGRQKVFIDLSLREAHSCIIMVIELYTASVVTTASIPLLQRPLVTKRSVR
nr:hypothetical protein CFP56_03179 [Quercus suber]